MSNTREIAGSSGMKASAGFMEFEGHCRVPDTPAAAPWMNQGYCRNSINAFCHNSTHKLVGSCFHLFCLQIF